MYALLMSETGGWRAAQPGTQIIRLLFDQPLKVKRISLVFEETENTVVSQFDVATTNGRLPIE